MAAAASNRSTSREAWKRPGGARQHIRRQRAEGRRQKCTETHFCLMPSAHCSLPFLTFRLAALRLGAGSQGRSRVLERMPVHLGLLPMVFSWLRFTVPLIDVVDRFR